MAAEVLSGHTELFNDLVRPHHTKVFRRCLAILKNHADAEEVVQETLLNAFSRLGQYRGDAQFGTWLVSIAHNACYARLRKFRYTHCTSLDSSDVARPLMDRLPALTLTPEQQRYRSELADLLREAISALPRHYRTVLYMRDIQEMKTAETAAALGVSTEVVKTRLFRARSMIHQWLAANRRGARRSPRTGGQLTKVTRPTNCRAGQLHRQRQSTLPAQPHISGA
jgi:RNA polymerase sigma-70 factor (ECF subfamily)